MLSQEVGRAGRDGDPAKCTLMLSKEDVTRQHSLSYSQTLGTLQILALFKRLFVPTAASRGATQGEAIEFQSEVAISLDRSAQECDIGGIIVGSQCSNSDTASGECLFLFLCCLNSMAHSL